MVPHHLIILLATASVVISKGAERRQVLQAASHTLRMPVESNAGVILSVIKPEVVIM